MKHTYIQNTLFLLIISLSILVHASEEFDQRRPDGVTDKKWNSLKAVVQETKLSASDGAGGENFGVSVSLLGDRALIGAYLDDDNGSFSGSAYIFDFDGNNWTQSKKLTANDGAAFERFGRSVSLSADRALIGAYLDDDNGTSSGSAYIFDFDGSNWVQTSKLTANDAATGNVFGFSVSLSGDRALIGAYLDNNSGTSSGSAYIFDFNGNNWVQTSKLLPNDAANDDQFSFSVSLSGDRALIGSTGVDDNGIDSGSAYVFDFNGSNWVQTSKLTANDAAEGDAFGRSVSLSGDRALVSAWLDDDNGMDSGSAYVFDFDGSNWMQTNKLLARDGALSTFFGFSVSLKGDRALIGANLGDNNGTSSGSAYVFDFDGSNWVQTSKLTASDGAANDLFGVSVSLSSDRALIGARLDDDNGTDSGSAYITNNVDFIFENGFE